MRLFGYIRVSTDEQAKEGHSLVTQELQIHKYCELYEHRLEALLIDEGVSAGIDLEKRPRGRALMERLRNGEAEGVVIQRIDRMTRVTLDGLLTVKWFAREGLALHSVNERIDTTSPEGFLQLTILLASAEYERNKIRQRARETMESLRSQAKVYGPTPYGCMQIDGRLFRDPTTWAVREQIMEWREQASLSLRAIVAELRHQEIAAPGGGRGWHVSTLQGIVNSHSDLQGIPYLEDVIDAPASVHGRAHLKAVGS